ncbi:MAG: tetratricopeptide repeat protein [Saprospiraceae bacterium]|nr:tetratricopeptide repeat protein [Saprospiraceae bacterium]
MKTIILIAAILCTTLVHAQTIGKVTYLEGEVLVLKDSWSPINIGLGLTLDDQIRTGSESLLEIQWQNGKKITLEPSSTYAIKDIYSAEPNTKSNQSFSILARIRKVLTNDRQSVATEEAGVRRSEVRLEVRDTNKLYWKQPQPVHIADLYRTYESGKYTQAAGMAKSWLKQNPVHARKPAVLLLLSDAYIQLNNLKMAKATLAQFISEYPSDPMAKDAAALEQVL